MSKLRNQMGMSLVGVMVAVAVSGVLGLTIMTLVDYMSRAAARIAIQESIKSTMEGILLCTQQTAQQCAQCLFNAAAPDTTPLTITPFAGQVTQNIGSIRFGGATLAERVAPLPNDNRVTVSTLEFREGDIASRRATLVSGVGYTTLYGDIVIQFDGPADLMGGAFRERRVPISLARAGGVGTVDFCGLGSVTENYTCDASTASVGNCVGPCVAPNVERYAIVAFDTTGQPVCGCYCTPPPAPPTSGPAAGPAAGPAVGPAGPAVGPAGPAVGPAGPAVGPAGPAVGPGPLK